MNLVPIVIAVLATGLAGLSFALAWKIWQKLRGVHTRLHRAEQNQQTLEQNLGVVSRLVTQSIASHVLEAPFGEIKCNAQHGEELFLWQLSGFQKHGVFVEIGAYDGASLSNSLFFESIGWKTVLIEAHPELANRCRENRPRSTVVHAALGETDGGSIEFSMVRGPTGMDTLSFLGRAPEHEARIINRGGTIEKTTVPARTLQSVIAEHQISQIDCMSVDVEGAELAVLKVAGLDRVKPKIILVEDNSNGEDLAVPQFLSSHGYVKAAMIGCNVIHVLDRAAV